MSEVKRYSFGFSGYSEGHYVSSADFDRVTAERDAALAELKTQTLRADAAVGDANEAEQRLTVADERADVLERVEARYRWIQKATPYRFKKIQDASVTDGGDVLYFHADRFDAAVDAALKPAEGRGDVD